jgi:hypothetical protein
MAAGSFASDLYGYRTYQALENAGLTFDRNQLYLDLRMCFPRAILATAIVVALATYAMDCSEIVSAEQAMQCCNTMPCLPHSHGKNCCETMPSTHPPFVQSASVNKLAFSSLAHAVIPTRSMHLPGRRGADTRVAQYRPPPTLLESLASSPLRI